MTRARTLALFACLLLPLGMLGAGKGGGGGGGGGRGGGGGGGVGGGGGNGGGGNGGAFGGGGGNMAGGGGGWRNNWQNPNTSATQTPDPKKQAEAAKKKLDKLIGDGFEALKASDTTAAIDDFTDALQLQNDHSLAHLGLGLARAQKGEFAAGQTEFSAALRAKADARLASYNLANSFIRQNAKARGMVLLDRLIAETKPVDELLVNAQRSLVATLDAKSKSDIGALPSFLKTLTIQETTLAAAHAPSQRWGVTWVSTEEVTRLRAAGTAEPFVNPLPFLLPGDIPLPEKGLKSGASAVSLNAQAIAPKAADSRVAANGAKSGDAGTPTTPSTPEPVTPMGRTVRGAAFSLTPTVLLTCNRLTEGAKSISVQALDGTPYEATVIASDADSGLALIEVSGGHFAPMALADAAKAGPVGVAAFPKPGVFSPNLEVLRGDLIGTPGSFQLRTSVHPRSAGSPVINDQGKVVAILTATRDDPLAQLPIVRVDVIRQFINGKFTAPTEAVAENPAQCVVEVTVTRVD